MCVAFKCECMCIIAIFLKFFFVADVYAGTMSCKSAIKWYFKREWEDHRSSTLWTLGNTSCLMFSWIVHHSFPHILYITLCLECSYSSGYAFVYKSTTSVYQVILAKNVEDGKVIVMYMLVFNCNLYAVQLNLYLIRYTAICKLPNTTWTNNMHALYWFSLYFWVCLSPSISLFLFVSFCPCSTLRSQIKSYYAPVLWRNDEDLPSETTSEYVGWNLTDTLVSSFTIVLLFVGLGYFVVSVCASVCVSV